MKCFPESMDTRWRFQAPKFFEMFPLLAIGQDVEDSLMYEKQGAILNQKVIRRRLFSLGTGAGARTKAGAGAGAGARTRARTRTGTLSYVGFPSTVLENPGMLRDFFKRNSLIRLDDKKLKKRSA